MKRIALVTTTPDRLTTPDLDTAPLLEALRARGVDATAPVWWDEDVDWSAFDLIVMRSPWDYPLHFEDFMAWFRGLDARRVANAPAIVEWNFDKTYLLELAEKGVPIVPTIVCPDLERVRLAVVQTRTEWVVIKPTISAASMSTHLMRADDPALFVRAAEIFEQGKQVLVEPAIPELGTYGEHAVYFINGEYSHAIHKGPLLEPGGGLRGGVYAENPAAAEPTDAELALAGKAWTAIGETFGAQQPLYARFDIVSSEKWGPLLIEAEMFEPQYFFRCVPGAVDRVADAFVARAQA